MTTKTTLSRPIAAKPLVDMITERLTSAIFSGELAPGTRISEQGLAGQLGVSRGPLREAIRRLEGRKLIERTPHKGARIAELGANDLDELLVMREALEGMACRIAAEKMTEDERRRLEKLIERHGASSDVREGTGYYQESRDFDFHFLIIKGSRNERLISILCGDLYDLLRVYRYKSSTQSGRTRQAFEEHCRIVAAILARDPDAAEAAMREHLANARIYAARLKADGTDGTEPAEDRAEG